MDSSTGDNVGEELMTDQGHVAPAAGRGNWQAFDGPCPICGMKSGISGTICCLLVDSDIVRCLRKSDGAFHSGYDPDLQTRVWLHRIAKPTPLDPPFERGEAKKGPPLARGDSGGAEPGPTGSLPASVQASAPESVAALSAEEAGEVPSGPKSLATAIWNALGDENLTPLETARRIEDPAWRGLSSQRILREASRHTDLFQIRRGIAKGEHVKLIRRNTSIIRPASVKAAPKTGDAAIQAVADWAAKDQPRASQAVKPIATPPAESFKFSAAGDSVPHKETVSQQAMVLAFDLVIDKVRSICTTRYEQLHRARTPVETRFDDVDELRNRLKRSNDATVVLWWLEDLQDRELAKARKAGK